jgi:hypothetical protein
LSNDQNNPNFNNGPNNSNVHVSNVLGQLQESGFYLIPSQGTNSNTVPIGIFSQSHMNGGSMTNLSASRNNHSEMARGFNAEL